MELPLQHSNNIAANNMLNEGWIFFKTQAELYATPADYSSSNQTSKSTSVPSTIASSSGLDKQKCWATEFDYDDYDWWYEKIFEVEATEIYRAIIFEGLATVAQVWLNGHPLLSSENMFQTHDCDVEKYLLQGRNKLTICFRSLTSHLKIKRPRPNWKTKLVSNQSLRWIRTTLLGKIPTWSPSISVVGPWRPITLVKKSIPTNIQLSALLKESQGIINFSCNIITEKALLQATILIDNKSYSIDVNTDQPSNLLNVCIEIPNVKLWWPHTHGTPHLYHPVLVLTFESEIIQYPIQPFGFKTVEINNVEQNFELFVNQLSIFCRGACWTIDDIFSLNSSEKSLEKLLLLFRNAGGNMIRIGGTMVYEQPLFYQICDRLGIMVWQDFMFANMDYPFENEQFLSSVTLEVNQQVSRLKQHACLAVFCGNSEIQQQVAMQGFNKSVYKIEFFENTLKTICNHLSTNIPYISSSPSEGNLPFRTNKGLSHYYGVGAYLNPVKDLRSHDVKFTSECLGFSNIPVTNTRNLVLDGSQPITHNPIWKQRTPRDSGTGWDFEDVRDHYLEELFSISPVKLRSFDPDKYIQLSEFVTGNIMEQVYSEWRSAFSSCNGGLVWFLKDFLPGAGWGIIDSQGIPKACYYFLKRSWKPQSIHLTDESLNGLFAHINNESPSELHGKILIKIINQNHLEIANHQQQISLPPRSNLTLDIEDLLQQFLDITYSYRFGPKDIFSTSVQLIDPQKNIIDEAFYFNQYSEALISVEDPLILTIEKNSDSQHTLVITANRFLFNINIECKNAVASDNFFHLFPGTTKSIQLDFIGEPETKIKGFIHASNMQDSIRFKR